MEKKINDSKDRVAIIKQFLIYIASYTVMKIKYKHPVYF